ncbi:MAG: lytic murein transglycosylase B [Gammaproteobacteria bacterium]
MIPVLGLSIGASANILERDDVQVFINNMASQHSFDSNQLEEVFRNVRISDSVLEAISRPAEALPWYKYRPIFIRADRIRLGAEFMEEYGGLLARAEKEYGVPEEIITAVIGVETRYGGHKGGYKVIDSLATLAFFYPKRSDFFRRELEQFLLMTREQKMDPHEVMGSYAGAMGIPQFISSSYRNYAVDFDDDGKIDIWSNPVDAIGSVANYFRIHGWKKGKQVIVPASVKGEQYEQVLSNGLKPHIRAGELPDHGVYARSPLKADEQVKLLEFELSDGKEYWLGLHNFYVITRYNHSALYAMAVYQLSQEIKKHYQVKYADKIQ